MAEIVSGVVRGIVSPLMDKLVIPTFKRFADNVKLDYQKNLVPIEKHFKEYFERTYERLSTINTIALKHTQKPLKDIYIPLTICTYEEERKTKFKINLYPKTLVNKYNRILVADMAGMGKSTLVKRIFIDIIEKRQGIPLFIELRRLSKDKPILAEIQDQINAINKDFNSSLLLELLANGEFIIILDGYDEISLTEKINVTADIQNFISKTYKNNFIITSRPEQGLSSFGDFKEFRIEPLLKNEAFKLLRKYDKRGKVSSLLIKKIKESTFLEINDFLTNPLLISLLFTAFEYKQKIPLKKHLFYRQVFDAYFDVHDITKGDSFTHDKYTGLGIDDFERIIRCLGFLCFKRQKIEFSKDELLNLFDECKDFCLGINFKSSDLLKDITTVVPIFTIDGIYYRWSHKSLQEYFAAQFIYRDSGNKREKILLAIYNSPNFEKFINIIDLYYDIDYKTFKRTIEYELLKDYRKYSEQHYTQKDFPVIEEMSLIRRKELLYGKVFYVIDATKKDDNKKWRKVLESTAIKQGSSEWYLASSKISNNNPDSIVYIIYYKDVKIDALFNVLLRKQNDIVIEIDKISNQNIIEVLDIKEAYTAYSIDSRKDNLFNSKDNFNLINKSIETSDIIIFDHFIMINHHIALLTLEEIEMNIKNENENSFLFEGIF